MAALAAFLKNFSLDEFNEEEKKFVRRTRLSQLLSSWNFNISSAAALDLYIKHAGGSSTTMALHYGSVQSGTNLCNMLIAPAVGCLSDTIGRKPLMMFGRCGWALWWLTLANIDKISRVLKLTPLQVRFYGEILCWGIVQAGTWSAYTASMADHFGQRPALMGKVRLSFLCSLLRRLPMVNPIWCRSAQVGTTGGIIWDLGQFSGSILGAWLARGGVGSFASNLSLYLSGACAIGTMVIFATLKEPLAKDKRKPFLLTEANPIVRIRNAASYCIVLGLSPELPWQICFWTAGFAVDAV
jgi:MFS family permease